MGGGTAPARKPSGAICIVRCPFGYPVLMIRRIQALNYRCLRYADVRLDRFHVLVGPNASGKSTLFDVVAFLGDLVRDDLEAAIGRRTRNFQDLVWGRPKQDLHFELAVEFGVSSNACG